MKKHQPAYTSGVILYSCTKQLCKTEHPCYDVGAFAARIPGKSPAYRAARLYALQKRGTSMPVTVSTGTGEGVPLLFFSKG